MSTARRPRGKPPGKNAPSAFERASAAADFVLSKTRLRPRIAVVLGSGLGAFADTLRDPIRIPYADIPGFPLSTAPGHAGALILGKLEGAALAVMQGRVHFYEGYPMSQVVFPVRTLARMGVQTLLLTCAAAGLRPEHSQGALVALRDHINFQGTNPLIGPNDERFGPRFPDMTQAYSRELRALAHEEGKRLGIPLLEGVYLALSGPSYETPAEIRAMQALGADLVGMSVVPEVIAARHMGLRVLAIACVTNPGAGMVDKPIDHEEVLETGRRVQGQLSALLGAVVRRLA